MSDEILSAVQSKYAAAARSRLSSDDAGVHEVAEAFGYSSEELASIPALANMGLSCGNPTALAGLKPGEVVVDLGCGGGLDVFLAAQQVAPQGRAVGIDMTPEMIARARANAAAGGYTNTEFHLATIDRLPLPNASADCVISNCVLNLAPDKEAVFREIYRVLKPGGRLAVSDIALKRELPAAVASSLAAYVGCIAGAIPIEEYRNGLARAGFVEIDIAESGSDLHAWEKIENQAGCCSPSVQPPQSAATGAYSCCSGSGAADASVHEDLKSLLTAYDLNSAAASVRVLAHKPAAQSCCGPRCCA